MRGTQEKLIIKKYRLRITPAYAGNTIQTRLNYCVEQDHPRLCGEHIYFFEFFEIYIGSPPPMRGTH